MVGGRKDALLLRCIDGHMRGRLPRCPMCKQGRLKIVDEDHDFASCNGYFDEDMQSRVPCSYQISLDKVQRYLPWYTEPPTEEQQEEMKAQEENHIKAGKGTLNTKHADTIQSLLNQANAMEWKTNNKNEIKATSQKLVEICQASAVDLPKGTELKAVGKIVVSNAKTCTAKQVMQMIVEEYGFAQDRTAAEQASETVAANLCKVPANAPLYSMLDEFAELMRKSGEFMKSNMQKKSAQAVAALPFEVTKENALSLGKTGKSKVPGIGKSTAEKMHEYLTTGKVDKLDELRASIE